MRPLISVRGIRRSVSRSVGSSITYVKSRKIEHLNTEVESVHPSVCGPVMVLSKMEVNAFSRLYFPLDIHSLRSWNHPPRLGHVVILINTLFPFWAADPEEDDVL